MKQQLGEQPGFLYNEIWNDMQMGMIVVGNKGPCGLQNGQLAPCPKSPNCVSTTHHDPNRQMLPVSYEGLSLNEAAVLLIEALETLPNMALETHQGPYIHAILKTSVFAFENDAEFYFDEAGKELHFRSASRKGWSDFGWNKRRMQSVTARFIRKMNQHKAEKID